MSPPSPRRSRPFPFQRSAGGVPVEPMPIRQSFRGSFERRNVMKSLTESEFLDRAARIGLCLDDRISAFTNLGTRRNGEQMDGAVAECQLLLHTRSRQSLSLLAFAVRQCSL